MKLIWWKRSKSLVSWLRLTYCTSSLHPDRTFFHLLKVRVMRRVLFLSVFDVAWMRALLVINELNLGWGKINLARPYRWFAWPRMKKLLRDGNNGIIKLSSRGLYQSSRVLEDNIFAFPVFSRFYYILFFKWSTGKGIWSNAVVNSYFPQERICLWSTLEFSNKIVFLSIVQIQS